MNTQQITPISKRAEVIHIEILRRNREKREQQAQTISAENRNLSLAWSK